VTQLNEIAEKAANDCLDWVESSGQDEQFTKGEREKCVQIVTRALQEANPELHRSREAWIKVAEDHGKTIAQLRQQLLIADGANGALISELGRTLSKLKQAEADRDRLIKRCKIRSAIDQERKK